MPGWEGDNLTEGFQSVAKFRSLSRIERISVKIFLWGTVGSSPRDVYGGFCRLNRNFFQKLETCFDAKRSIVKTQACLYVPFSAETDADAAAGHLPLYVLVPQFIISITSLGSTSRDHPNDTMAHLITNQQQLPSPLLGYSTLHAWRMVLVPPTGTTRILLRTDSTGIAEGTCYLISRLRS